MLNRFFLTVLLVFGLNTIGSSSIPSKSKSENILLYDGIATLEITPTGQEFWICNSCGECHGSNRELLAHSHMAALRAVLVARSRAAFIETRDWEK